MPRAKNELPLIILSALLACGATPLYSPKHKEQVWSLRRVAVTNAPKPVPKIPLIDIRPLLVVPPPPTNLFYIIPIWSNNPACDPGPWIYEWGTKSGQYSNSLTVTANAGTYPSEPHLPFTNMNWTRISNLVHGTTYYFQVRTDPCNFTSLTESTFPLKQPPFTNWVWVGASNWSGITLTNPSDRAQIFRIKAGMLQAALSLSGPWSNLKAVIVPSGATNIFLRTVSSNNQIASPIHKQ